MIYWDEFRDRNHSRGGDCAHDPRGFTAKTPVPVAAKLLKRNMHDILSVAPSWLGKTSALSSL